jgi:NADPH:quinone reductase-like Zn-dependent oxidoreductase
MTTMQAFRIHEFGGPETLRPDRVEIPEPRAGQVRVQVVAASLNPVDNKTREGGLPAGQAGPTSVHPGAGFRRAGRIDRRRRDRV